MTTAATAAANAADAQPNTTTTATTTTSTRGTPSRTYSSSARPPPISAAAVASSPSPSRHRQQYDHESSRDRDRDRDRDRIRDRDQAAAAHHHRRAPSSSSRPSTTHHDFPQDDDETAAPRSTTITSSHPRRSASHDRQIPLRGPAPSSAGPDASTTASPPSSARPHRRTSSRSNPQPAAHGHHRSQSSGRHAHSSHHSDNQQNHPRPYQPDMPSAAPPDHGSPSAPPPADAHQHASPRQSKSRTTIPTQSGKWILGKTIGAGSMGKVKLARKEETGEQVACKIIPRGSTDDGHQSRADKERADQSKEIRTSREAAIVTLLNHPHICGLRDVVRTNYHWYMLFEYVNGGQMLDYIISHGKLKEKQARKFSRQIASALDYCHRNSIVHRDLKIENILISKNGDIKIIDFGLSNLFAPRGHLKTFCGSLYFAAPELLQARAYTGPEVDVWSFGIVLYVLVCGRVPFDDQNMPALHAKIKKGVVVYPNWVSTECKQLISRMLVTDPKQRATMQEVMYHPWMTKGFSGPPENYLPAREPIIPPLEPEVIHAMQGFNFGSPETIRAQLLKTIESDEYQRAVRLYEREKETVQPAKDVEKKRSFGLDFYKRRNSQHSRDTLTGPSSEALQLGSDPMNAFSPLLSIYYLVREKQERERTDVAPPPTAVAREKEREREREREREKEKERYRREAEDERRREKEAEAMPELAAPQAALTNSAAYEMPGERPTGGRTRPRARTHGEDEIPETIKAGHLAPPDTKPDHREKKEGTAAGLLRRFSTRKRRDPDRHDRDRSHPPVVQVHTPPDGATQVPRKSFSMRRGRREREVSEGLPVRSGSSQPQHRELLSPPVSAGGSRRSSGLGRSTSVNSADVRRHQSTRLAKEQPLPTMTGSDHSMSPEQPVAARPGHGHSRSVSMRAKSLGHARRESIQQRRQQREAAALANESSVVEETDADNDQSGPSSERLDSSELAKPVFLKGLFSVSTTSGKSVPAIRTDIKRVLRQLNVEYEEIKGGFSCRHAPSIDLNRVQDQPPLPQQQQQPPMSPNQTSQGRPRFSLGLRRGDSERDDSERSPTTPRTPGRSEQQDRSYSNSETSVDSIPRRTTGASRRAPGETSTQVQSDLGEGMILEFEIFIVKVPLLSLHGIQFKRMEGNTWQFKNMADQILKELRL